MPERCDRPDVACGHWSFRRPARCRSVCHRHAHSCAEGSRPRLRWSQSVPRTGSHATHAAGKFGFRDCTTDESQLIRDPADQHRRDCDTPSPACEAGSRGSRGREECFCEKPLCLSEAELRSIVRAYLGIALAERPALMVGFNRRFAPMTARMKAFLARSSEPLALHYRINAGFLSPDHWVNDREQGGGRILGEVCHFVDLLMFLAGSPIVRGRSARRRQFRPLQRRQCSGVTALCQRLRGHDQLSRQWGPFIFKRADRSVWRRSSCRARRFSPSRTCTQRSKRDHAVALASGQRASRRVGGIRAICIRQLGAAPIAFEEIVCSTLATLRVDESLATGKTLTVDAAAFIDRQRISSANPTRTNDLIPHANHRS